MTKTEEYVSTLPERTVEKISALFGSAANLYAVCYLIAQNEHYYTMDKPADWERKVATVQVIQEKIETLLTQWGLSGKDVLADIKSDYLDDFIAYKIRTFNVTEAQFISTIKAIQELSV